MLVVRPNLAGLLAIVSLLALPAAAQQPSAAQQQAAFEADPPSEAARFSYASGSVSLQPAGVDDWTAPAINRPLTVGDQLWSDRGSRAEFELGSAAVRLSENTAVALLSLTDEGVQLRISSGSVVVALRALDPHSSFEIDAPNAAIAALQPGEYRIDVDAVGNTTVQLRGGLAQITGSGGQSITLQVGQGGQFGANGGLEVVQVGPADDFDRWSEQRDQRWARSSESSSQYVASDAVGAAELSDYGQWQSVSDYGYVWFPAQVTADWAPYSDGHWLWVAPWGWTWVDSAPWGFAPFHYGRWAYFNQRWGWVPAPPRYRAVYAPALVVWVGTAGGDAVGWVPLAPGEVYVPGYRVSAHYAQNVNVSNTTVVNTHDINNVYQNPLGQHHYANQTVPRAMTVMPQSSFTAGQGVRSHTVAASPRWQAMTPMAQAPAIVPARASVLGAGASFRVNRPPPALLDRPVLGRRLPPAPPQFNRAPAEAMRGHGERPQVSAPLPAGADSHRAYVTIVQAPPAPRNLSPVWSPPSAPSVQPRVPGVVIPERSPQFQPPAQSQQQRPSVSTEQLERNGQLRQQAPNLPIGRPIQPSNVKPRQVMPEPPTPAEPVTQAAPQPQIQRQPRPQSPIAQPLLRPAQPALPKQPQQRGPQPLPPRGRSESPQ